jgi:hypothetical protein
VLIDEPKVEIKSSDAVINAHDMFICDTFSLFALASFEKLCRDCNSVYWTYGCDDIPINQINYLGIQITSNGIKRLGWMKLYAQDRDRILLISTGIQINK